MAQYEHLQLVRLPERLERRKTGGGGEAPKREPGAHARKLTKDLDAAVETQVRRRRPDAVDPALILRVQMTGPLLEEDWNKAGLTLLSSDEDRKLVLFADSDQLTDFRRRIDSYAKGTPAGQKNPSYNAFISGIEAIGSVEPRDRIGVGARGDGFVSPDDFISGVPYVVDIELWDIGRRDYRERTLEDLSTFVEANSGQELDRYIGPAITMVRFECDGSVVRNLLSVESVAELDFRPAVDTDTHDLVKLTLADLPAATDIHDDAPLIGVIDSGLNAHPLIEDIIVGAIGVPDALGTSDEWGHGTKVAGVSVFGDLRQQLGAGTLGRGARLCSARVLDDKGEFPNKRLTAGQMREAITRLHETYGCRIFVIALGDKKKVYDGGKVGVWAATLDELVRELDIVIVVSSGNRPPRKGLRIEEAITDYPHYLTESENRLCEPAGAMNVLTVGALAHDHGIPAKLGDDIKVQAITQALQPSPFTRVGPGLRGGIKPDLVDLGGTLIFDGGVARLRGGEEVPAAGVLTLYHRFIDQLFTAASGTSYSAPLVAFKASQILARFPGASANLIRTLLAASASIPEASTAKLALLGDRAVRNICGNGQVDLEKAVFSDDSRVVFYAEDELAIDHFAVYQIPIPDVFQETKGRRHIRISLAYDPPVKHSRLDYAGVTMGFRLIRGCDADFVFDHFKKRDIDDGKFPEMPGKFNCKLTPSSTLREKSSLQTATATFDRTITGYGDTYYLVVRCAGGWAGEVGHQAFAVTVELAHEVEIQLYERLLQRIRVKV
ncbi:S8 family peptidase [Rhizobium sp. BR 315]|uniref:S8 family peptidase n=1 Tax=Rhizobium sp. BR 315 TaxID=3040014 RepID=UPI003D32D983